MKNTLAWLKSAIKLIQVAAIQFLSNRRSRELPVHVFERALIVSPHPDDEVLGCGGLIGRLVRQGKDVYVLMLTNGEAAHRFLWMDAEELAAKRKELLANAAGILGLPTNRYSFMNLADGKLHEAANSAEEREKLISTVNEINPDAIFVPHIYEGARDHEAVAELFRSLAGQKSVNAKRFYYCVWVWHKMPFFKIFCMEWKKSFTLLLNKQEASLKTGATNAYIKPVAPFGKPYSGVIPMSIVKAARWKKELYFETE
jgi:LmbE family N-acetylglucosaminyl deacetylase